MAKAPKPKSGGYDAAKERQERAKQTFRVTVKDSDISFVYRPYGLPIRVRGLVREMTGKSVDLLLWGTEGIDVATYVDLWWISRLCDDEAGAAQMLVSESKRKKVIGVKEIADTVATIAANANASANIDAIDSVGTAVADCAAAA